MEVSIDEPLNVDWDGNELLLSDVLGTEDDVISRRMEDEVEIKLLGKAINKLSPQGADDHQTAFWPQQCRRQGKDPERSCRSSWDFPVATFPDLRNGS